MAVQVRFIGRPWPNHSVHSGYHQLAGYLGTELPAPDTSTFWGTWLPGRLAVKLAQRSGVAQYDYRAFYHEWAAAKEMLRLRQKTIYHILYGDQFFRYLGRMRLTRYSRIVATFHMPPMRLEKALTFVGHLRTLDALIVVGSNQVSFFSQTVSADRIHVVPHGIDTETFTPRDDEETTGKRSKRCLFVGVHERDLATLEAVIDIIGREDPAVEFTLVTSRDVAAIFAGRPNVVVYSEIPERKLITLYQQADLLIQPLLESTANNAILEGLACGLPVVATDVGAVRDYLTDRCAITVRGGDARHMATAINEVLDDEGRRREMASEARLQARKFEWPMIAARIGEIYEQLA